MNKNEQISFIKMSLMNLWDIEKRGIYESQFYYIYIWAESINLRVIYLLFKANYKAMSMCSWWEGDVRPNFLVVLFTIFLPYHSFSQHYTTLLRAQVNEIETQNSGSLYIPYTNLYAVCYFLKLSVLTSVYYVASQCSCCLF